MSFTNSFDALNKVEQDRKNALRYRLELREIPLAYNPSVFLTITEDELRMAVELGTSCVSVSRAWRANKMGASQLGYVVMAVDEIAPDRTERRLYERRDVDSFISKTIEALLRHRPPIVYAE